MRQSRRIRRTRPYRNARMNYSRRRLPFYSRAMSARANMARRSMQRRALFRILRRLIGPQGARYYRGYI